MQPSPATCFEVRTSTCRMWARPTRAHARLERRHTVHRCQPRTQPQRTQQTPVHLGRHSLGQGGLSGGLRPGDSGRNSPTPCSLPRPHRTEAKKEEEFLRPRLVAGPRACPCRHSARRSARRRAARSWHSSAPRQPAGSRSNSDARPIQRNRESKRGARGSTNACAWALQGEGRRSAVSQRSS